jgi:hypothetical protein
MFWLRKAVKDAVEKTVRSELDRVLPGMTEAYMKKRFKDRPNEPLSPIGFTWAFVFELERWWKGVPRKEAAKWLREYMDVPIGTEGYIWTAAAAEELAREYASEFGEAVS